MKRTLVIMAAGMGSRFKEGIKQLTGVGPAGELIIDYSIHDAIRAGFDHVVFVIRRDIEQDFREAIGERVEQKVAVDYAFQELDDIPEDFREAFAGRTKPWGTGSAVLACRHLVDGPFVVINADDYYGREAFVKAAAMLEDVSYKSADDMTIGMISFILKNTLSDNGTVTRGICMLADDGTLASINETKNIEKTADGAATEIDGKRVELDVDSPVSMNMWVYPKDFMELLDQEFVTFLAALEPGDNSSEYLLPILAGELLEAGRTKVLVERSHDRWFGMTYKEDVPGVRADIAQMVADGVYPKDLYQ